MVLAQLPPAQEKDCTGFVVSPHVVVTAAHCLDPAVLGSDGFTFYVYMGDDIDDPTQNMVGKNFIRVAETHFDPAFSSTQLGGGHDIGVIVTKTALGVPAYAMRTVPLGADLVGKPVRQVGFGKTNADAPASYGARYQTASTIDSILAAELASAVGPPGGCEGDSGGPLLLNVGGSDIAIGVFSWGEHATTCTGRGNYTRVDALRDFVVPYVKAADPDFVLPADPSPIDGASPVADGGTADGGSETAAGGCSVATVRPANVNVLLAALLWLSFVVGRQLLLRRG